MNYQFVRVPLDSCDFSIAPYDGYRSSGAPYFEHMENYILPMLRDIEAVAGRKIPVMLSPWSPPAFMKSNGIRQQGGKLLPEYYAAYADYLCRYALEMRRLGFIVDRMSLQNEPKAVQTWDSCIFTAQEEKRFLRDYFRPAQERWGLAGIKVYLWDHNKERVYEWMRDIIDETTDPMVAGACFHWYSGDHFEALDLCRKRFPDKVLILSESCIEYSNYDRGNQIGAAQRLSHELMGDLNHGITAFFDWNLLLDETGGPNYVGNYCMAPYHFDRQSKTLEAKLLQAYYEAFAKVAVPGTVRVETTRFSDQVDATCWKHPNGALALALLNRGGEARRVTVRNGDMEATVELAPYALETFLCG